MQDPYYPRFPGPGRIPQANPADHGTGGLGADSLGTQFRDWTTNTILARITGHGTGNAYSWKQVYLSNTTGTYSDLGGGLAGTNTAFEANNDPSVPADPTSGLIVELWPNYGSPGYWTFVRAVAGGAPVSALVRALTATAAGVSGVNAECYSAAIVTLAAGTQLNSMATGESVWLTISGESGPEAPISGLSYVAALSSDTLTISGDTRRRAVAQPILPTECVGPIHSSICVDGVLSTTDFTFRVINRSCA